VDISIPQGERAKPAASRPPGSNDEGKALAAKVAESLGGEAKLREIKSIRQRVTSVRKSPQGEVPIQVAQTVIYPDRAAVLMQMPAAGAVSMVITPTQGFTALGNDLQTMDTAELAERSKAIRRDLIYIAQNSGHPKFVFAVTGTETIGATKATVLEIDADGAETRWYVDPESGRLLRAVYNTLGEEGPTERTIDYSDWRKLDGINIPVKRVISDDGQPIAEDEVKQLEINPPVDPKIFERPISTGRKTQ
jgi:hypothetical protein